MSAHKESESGGGPGPKTQATDRTLPDTRNAAQVDATLDGSSMATTSPETEDAAGGMTVDQFVKCIAASGLMSEDEVRSIQDSLPPEDISTNADTFADELVRRRKLTPYQVQVLRQGTSTGLIIGRYVVLEKLGAGGMGMVFKAYHRRMKRTVAVKVLPPEFTGSEAAIARFHREVEAVAKLSHPNIVAAYDADEDRGVHFLVMEYVEGIDLGRYVRDVGTLGMSAAVDVILQSARGLAHAHERGIIHRDIKPSNLLLDSTGVVKILDMGLARLERGVDEETTEAPNDLTQSGRVMGTVDYMAPEQAIDAKRADHRADIYSLGCTLHHLVTGGTLAPDGALTKKLLWHQNEAPPKLSEVAEGVPPELDALFEEMLAKKVDDRPSDVAEVIQRLDGCRGALPDDGGQLANAAETISAGSAQLAAQALEGVHGGATIASSVRGAAEVDTKVGAAARTIAGSVTAPAAPSRSRTKAIIGVATAAVLAIAGWFGFAALTTPAASTGLALNLHPGDATVTLDGVPLMLPAADAEGTIRVDVEPGAHQIIVAKEGFDDDRRTVQFAEGETTEVAVELQVAEALPAPNGAGEAVATETVVEAAPTPVVEPPKPKIPHEEFLKWVYSLGGEVTVVSATGDPIPIRTRAAVPEGEFTLEALTLDGTGVVDEQLSHLAEAIGLKRLSLQHTQISDAGLAHVKVLENLESLSLTDTDISDEGLAHLVALPKLRTLMLGETPITDRAALHLGAMPQLVSLHASDTQLSNASLENIANLSTLRELSLNGTSVTWEGVQALRDRRNGLRVAWDSWNAEFAAARRFLSLGGVVELREGDDDEGVEVSREADLSSGPYRVVAINVHDNPKVKDDDLEVLRALESLERLNLAGTSVTDGGLETISGIEGLTSLDLGRLRLDEEEVEKLGAALPNCTIDWEPVRDRDVADWVLGIGGRVGVRMSGGGEVVPVNDPGGIPAGEFWLRSIDLSGNEQVANDDLAQLDGLSELETVRLNGTRIDDAGLTHLRSCRRIRELNLTDTGVTNEGTAALLALGGLAELYLGGTQVSDDAMPRLNRLARLERLSLANTDVSDKAIASLEPLNQLSWLVLSGTRITDAAVEPLGGLTSLRRLMIDGTEITDAGCEELALLRPSLEVKCDPPDAQRLLARWVVEHQGRADVMVDGASEAVVVDSLEDLPRGKCKVVAIDVRRGLQRGGTRETRITYKEIGELAGADSLERLDLRGTDIDDRAFDAIAKMASLRELLLSKTFVTDAGIAKLSSCAALELLDLEDCQSVTGATLDALAGGGQLKRVVLARTATNDAGLAAVGRIQSLVDLDLSGLVRVTDAGIANLTEVAGLKHLRLAGTRVTDGVGESLAEMAELSTLDLSVPAVTDGVLTELRELENLRELLLNNTNVTESSFSAFTELEQLAVLGLANTRIESIEPLRSQMEGCVITHSQRLERPQRPGGRGGSGR